MRDMRKKLKVGVVQLEPALFDAAGSLERLLRFADEAALGGAELVVFPELAIPGYPYGLSFGFTVGGVTSPGARTGRDTRRTPSRSPARRQRPSAKRPRSGISG